jgi:membrane protease YdiL (CAAX protease family)
MTEASDRPPLIAPVRHTLWVIAILLAIAAYGAYLQATSHAGRHLVEQRGSALPLYLSLLAAEWGLLRFVYAGGLRKTGTRLRDLLGSRWRGWPDVARDTGIALAVWAAWAGLETYADHVLGPDAAKGIDTLLPRNVPEAVAWALLSVSAGFCEEVIFRGYLQKQFEALTGRATLAAVGQAVIFGISHGYQGVRNVLVISVLGALYGALARWRRSLKPGMILHAWMDIFGGLLARRA